MEEDDTELRGIGMFGGDGCAGVQLPKPPPLVDDGGASSGNDSDPTAFTLSSTLGKAITEMDLGKTPTNS